MSSVLYSPIVDSISALSNASPTLPIEAVIPASTSASENARDVYWDPAMLSCESSRHRDLLGTSGLLRLAGVEQVVDLAGEVALEAADRLHLAVPHRGAFGDVGLRPRVHSHPADDGEVQGT